MKVTYVGDEGRVNKSLGTVALQRGGIMDNYDTGLRIQSTFF